MHHPNRGCLRHGFHAAALAIGATLATAQFAAADVILPPDASGTESGSENAFPFNTDYSNFSAMRYEQVYDSAAFGASPVTIYGMSFRPDAVFGSAFTTTLGNVSILLSTTSATPSTLSSDFATNEGADLTLVLSGELTLSSAFTGPDGGPKDFDISIVFDTPFTYTPTDGDLLLEVQNFSGGLTTQFDAESSDQIGRVFSLDNSATGSSGLTDMYGLVTKFITTQINQITNLTDDPTPVPEPGSLVLFGTALAAFGRFRRRRQQR